MRHTAAYCIYELRLSEDEAQRRCRAARVAREFPVLFSMLADASIHLTGILPLAPYLTVENHREVLARARYWRKREIERLVAELAPARDVPELVEPLRPAVHRGLAPSTWASLLAGNEGWVRHLKTGDGPAQVPNVSDEWHEALATTLGDLQSEPTATEASGFAQVLPRRSEGADAPAWETSSEGSDAPAREAANDVALPPLPGAAPAPALRYRVQFTADQAYVDLLERARDLLWHQLPHGDLAALQRLALESLVEKLMARKCGSLRSKAKPQPTDDSSDAARARTRARGQQGAAPASSARSEPNDIERDAPARAELQADAAPARSDLLRDAPARSNLLRDAPARSVPADIERDAPARAELQADAAPARSDLLRDAPARSTRPNPTNGADALPAPAARSSRHIPAAVRRQVWQRDGGRCTLLDARGVRCRATRAIEFHHEQPYALGGPHGAENITLRCRSHDELAAESDFGRELMRAMKHSLRPSVTK